MGSRLRLGAEPLSSLVRGAEAPLLLNRVPVMGHIHDQGGTTAVTIKSSYIAKAAGKESDTLQGLPSIGR